MKLQTKLLATLLAGTLLVSVASQFYQQWQNARLVKRLADENLKHEEVAQWDWVERLQHAVTGSLVEAMAKGEMDRFAQLLQSQREVKGLLELSLYNLDGVITYSTVSNRLRAAVAADLRGPLFVKAEIVRRRTDDAFELHEPLRITKSCLECHNEFKEGGVGGVMTMRFSTKTLQEAQHQWTGLEQSLKHASLINSVSTTGVLSLVTCLLVLWVVRHQIARPLDRVSSTLSQGSDQVREASKAINDASVRLAESASEQAASLEETSSSLEEMASMTKSNAENAQRADTLARQTTAAAEGGMTDVEALRTAMEGIRASGSEVAKIIRTIDEIAFQTNILALNAAVEAARAGEVGMGFAVVAEEVRNLSQRSAEAARETAARIEEAVTRGNRGAELSEQVGLRLGQVLDQTRQVTQLIASVASACQEQSQGVAQLNQAVSQIDAATQANAASAEESASASQELKVQSEDLRQVVVQLGVLVHGNGREMTPRQAPAASPHRPSVGRGRPAPQPERDPSAGEAHPALPDDNPNLVLRR